MQTINPFIVKSIQQNLFTTAEDVTRSIRIGLQAAETDKFFRKAVQEIPEEVLSNLREFIRGSVGQYPFVEVDVDSPNRSIMFYTLADDSREGFQFLYQTSVGMWRLYKVTSVMGYKKTIKVEGGNF